MTEFTYKDAGVDLHVYQEAMARLPALMQRTRTPRVMDLPDGFAGLLSLGRKKKFGKNYKDPVLVSGTDGVGTKIKVAILAGVYTTVGIDLVAMSVNDCLCLGATPLLFLDYLALGKDDPDLIGQLVSGVADGCVEAGAALLGGETAVMPDLYAAGDFDLAGFCVAVVERKQMIDGRRIRAGDVLLGLESTGFHSNGYSLVRKVVFEHAQLQIDAEIPELKETVGQALLRPTRIYVRPVLELLKHPRERLGVHGLAHITGGGLADNLERILPEGCRATIDRSTWQPSPLFGWLQQLGNIDRDEMFRVFNMGIGYVLVLRPKLVESFQQRLAKAGISSTVIGEMIAGERGVSYVN